MNNYEANYYVDVDLSGVQPRAAVKHNRGLSQFKFENDIKLKKAHQSDLFANLTIECSSRHEAKLVTAAIETYQAWLRQQLRKRRNVMTTFTFKTREEYLAYRANWKADYMERSVFIRNLKTEIKDTQKSGGYAGSDQCEREMLRAKQRRALEELASAKIEAAEQYKARKALELEAA